jgi:hypothetical protein
LSDATDRTPQPSAARRTREGRATAEATRRAKETRPTRG